MSKLGTFKVKEAILLATIVGMIIDKVQTSGLLTPHQQNLAVLAVSIISMITSYLSNGRKDEPGVLGMQSPPVEVGKGVAAKVSADYVASILGDKAPYLGSDVRDSIAKAIAEQVSADVSESGV